MNWLNQIIFLIVVIMISYFLIFAIYMLYIFLYIFGLLPNILPFIVVDMIKRMAFMYIQIFLPIYMFLLVFLILIYIIYCIIRVLIPKTFLKIPIRKMILKLPPFPDLINSGIFDLFDSIIKIFGGKETLLKKLGITSSSITKFAIKATSYIFKGIFPNYNEKDFINLINNKEGFNNILEKYANYNDNIEEKEINLMYNVQNNIINSLITNLSENSTPI